MQQQEAAKMAYAPYSNFPVGYWDTQTGEIVQVAMSKTSIGSLCDLHRSILVAAASNPEGELTMGVTGGENCCDGLEVLK